MKLQTVGPPDRGSLSIVYSCPECGYEFAMLTNAYETQAVQSLGVKIGPDRGADAPSASGAKCPFGAMIPAADQPATDHTEHTDAIVRWTAAAEARLANIPEFVRPMAKTGIERFARDQGTLEIDERILDQAKDFFGM
jgi:Proto-chlorophyllide reductase 57 kD subunit